MLQSMRTVAASWVMKIMLGALVLSFVSFYGWRSGQDVNPLVTAAVVDGDPIPTTELNAEVENVLRAYQNMGLLKDQPTEQIRSVMQLRVLADMINRKLKMKAAHAMGIVASNEKTRKTIERQFADQEGNFDFEIYQKILTHRLYTTPAAYEAKQKTLQVAQRFDHIVQQSAFVSEWELRETFKIRNQKANLQYVELKPETIAGHLKVSSPLPANEVKAHYEAHQDQYRRPETRQLEIVELDFASLLKPTPQDLEQQLSETFPEDKVEQAKGNRLRAAHILIRTSGEDTAKEEAKAQNLYQQLKEGANFAELARKESEDMSRSRGGDLGYFGKGKMVPEFEKIALTLEKDQISQPVKSQFGFHIIRLMDRITPGEVTVARLEPELTYRWKKGLLSKPEKSSELYAEAKTILENFKLKAEAAGSLKGAQENPILVYQETDFVSDENSLAGYLNKSQIYQVSWALLENEVGEPIHDLLGKKAQLVRVVKIQEGTLPPLAEVKEKVEEDLLGEKRQEAVLDYGKQLISEGKESKKGLAALASKNKLNIEETGLFARSPQNHIPKIGESASLTREAFTLTTGQPYIADPVTINDKIYVVALKEKQDPDWDKFSASQEELQKAATEENGRNRLQKWVERLRAQAEIQQYIGMTPPTG